MIKILLKKISFCSFTLPPVYLESLGSSPFINSISRAYIEPTKATYRPH
nr:MAG TPA: hypothetical protein [Caudoviricetes sp.]